MTGVRGVLARDSLIPQNISRILARAMTQAPIMVAKKDITYTEPRRVKRAYMETMCANPDGPSLATSINDTNWNSLE